MKTCCVVPEETREPMHPIVPMIFGLIVCAGLVLSIYTAIMMKADAIHESAQLTIRQADALLSGDGHLVAAVAECRDLVETVSEEKYVVVRDYQREITRLQQAAVR